MRTLGSILRGGSEQLMAERQDSPEGGAKETAVLAALRLLRAAFDRDQAAVAFLRQSDLSGARCRGIACSLVYVHPTALSVRDSQRGTLLPECDHSNLSRLAWVKSEQKGLPMTWQVFYISAASLQALIPWTA